MVDIDELERLLAAATPGGVRSIKHNFEIEGNCYAIVNPGNYPIAFTPAWDAPKRGQVGAPDEAEANAALIVAARNSLPAILTEIRELRAENARLKEGMATIRARKWDSMKEGCDAASEAARIARASLGEHQ